MLSLPPVLLDAPVGKALSADISGKVVVTIVQGIPYLLDVLDGDPLALLVREDGGQISTFLEQLDLQRGRFLYLGPRLEYSPLTPCERRVLRMIAFGLSNAEIAHKVGRKTSTVNTQVSAILAKLSVPSRHAATSLYWGHPSPPVI